MRLRVFDLKTGDSKASEKQLWVYIAIFCHEYEIDINEIEIDARIYQHDMIYTFEIDPVEILNVIALMKRNDDIINNARLEAML